jgi:hypothetical protein
MGFQIDFKNYGSKIFRIFYVSQRLHFVRTVIYTARSFGKYIPTCALYLQ